MLDIDAVVVGDRVRFVEEWEVVGRVTIPAGTVATVKHVPDDDAQRLAIVPDDVTLQAALALWRGEVVFELPDQLPDVQATLAPARVVLLGGLAL
jgi:hypothetical protein